MLNLKPLAAQVFLVMPVAMGAFYLSAQVVSPLGYGAVSDAKSTVDGAMTSRSASLRSPAGLFTPADVGKTISVQSAGGTSGSNQPLVTTIAAYVSPTQVALTAAATQTVSGQGVIWGTDNMAAFQAWAAALPGKNGVIPSGKYLVNAQYNNQSITLGSNENITMDRSGALYYVGASLSNGSGGPLLAIPAGTANLVIDSFHIIGEWQNTSTVTGVSLAYGYGATIMFGGITNPIRHVTIKNGLFENTLGVGAMSFGSFDYDITLDHNTFSNYANTGINVNSDNTSVTNNYFSNGSVCAELSGGQSHYKNNTCVNAGGQYAMEFGGRTSGSPGLGTEVSGNIVISPQASGCFSVGDGFSSGTISNNTCYLTSSAAQFGFVVHQGGSVPTTNNLFEGNGVVGNSSTGGSLGFYINGVSGNIFRDNWTGANMQAAVFNLSTGNNSTQNHWNGWGGLTVDNNSSGRFQDYVASGTFSLTRGSTVSADTVIDGPSGVVCGPPPSTFACYAAY